jgi:hypothetical protein
MHDVNNAPRGANDNRGGRRANPPRHRGNEQRNRGDQRPFALSFDSIIYSVPNRQLIAVVIVTKGGKPMEAVAIQLLVPPTPIGTGTTDRYGRVTIVADLDLPPKTHALVATVLGDVPGQTHGAFVVPQPNEVTEQTPMLEVSEEHVKVGADFSLVATVTARRGSTPMQNQLVYVTIDDGTSKQLESAWTNAQGVAQKRFTVTVNGRTIIPVTVTVNMTGATHRTKFLTLECEPSKPVTMPYRASEIDEVAGIWEITANPEDAQHNPCKGVRLTVTMENGQLLDKDGKVTTKNTRVTNEHGEARFRVRTSQVDEESKFTIDCPSIRNNGILRLWRYINPKRMPNHVLYRICDTIAGSAVLILFACTLLLITGAWRHAISNPNQPYITSGTKTAPDDGLTDVQRSVYQHMKLDTLKYSTDPTVRRKAATRDSLAALPPASGIPFGISVGSLLMTMFVCTIMFILSVPVIVFQKLKRLKELTMRKLRVIHEGVADNDPGFMQRLEDRALVMQPATPAGTPAAEVAPAVKKEAGFMSHMPAVALFGITDLIVDRFLSRKNKK